MMKNTSFTSVEGREVQNIDPDLLATATDTSRDDLVLARFGKRQQMRRGFRPLSAIGLTCGLMVTWELILMTLQYGLQNGGPAGLVYGYIFAWCGTILQGLVMAEMASMIPLAGGPFNWVAVLSPPSCRKFLSYIAGWLSVIAYQSMVANVCFICGLLIQGLITLNNDNYVFERWHSTLLFYVVLAFALSVNTYLGRLLPQIESVMLLIHIMGFFAILIPVVYLTPKHKTAHEVFTTFQNLGGWQTNGLSFFVGLITCTGSFLGVDAADHIAEETQNAVKTVPTAIVSSIIMNGALGFAMLLAVLFSMDDIVAATTSKTGFPFMDIFVYASGSTHGGTALAAIVTSINIFSSCAVLASASRMLWAFARERGLPGSGRLSQISPKAHLPLWAIGATAVINMLLALINIGSSTAFQAFVSLLIASYYSSFLVAAGVMLHKRLTTPEDRIPWGPFRLRKFGLPITIVAMCYTVIGLFFSFWPYALEINAVSMNYSVLIYGAALIFSLAFWVFHGRHVYKGPIAEVSI